MLHQQGELLRHEPFRFTRGHISDRFSHDIRISGIHVGHLIVDWKLSMDGRFSVAQVCQRDKYIDNMAKYLENNGIRML